MVQESIATLAKALGRAIAADTNAFKAALEEYLTLRSSVQRLLDEDDYKYMAFQLWQEGVSMYIEYRMADLAATSYEPTAAFRALPDYRPFGEIANAVLGNVLETLPELDLGEMKRVGFYYLGAGEALLLDRANPGWLQNYFPAMFSLDDFWQKE